MPETQDIQFRPLAEADLAALHDGLNRPHLRTFFQKRPISLAEVEAKYAPYARGVTPTHCHLAMTAGRVFGYLQCYLIVDYPDWAELTGENEGIGVDLAILEPDMIGKGFGTAMLHAYLARIAFPLFEGETRCLIAQEATNHAGLANSRKVGFRHLRTIMEDGLETELLVLERSQVGA